MNLSNSLLNWYKKSKQVLNDSNVALVDRGLNGVSNLHQISTEIDKLGEVNRLPYLLNKKIIELTENDLKGVTQINSNRCSWCNNLRSVITGDDVQNISDYAFTNCKNLESVTLGSSIKSIGTQAFDTCTNLANMYCYPITPPYLSGSSSIPTTTTIHVPVGSGEAYRNATNWSYHASRIVEDVVI